ncbi:hypothetical protein L484_010993 [Morus notabilis]|uniref:Uncharacterized protein n=1 Tax=Morus notabilis TaxID=981085 RepID=W9R6U7_9ROSA|nr:hypothetical protein L484_010993 [Morus notabilis]
MAPCLCLAWFPLTIQGTGSMEISKIRFQSCLSPLVVLLFRLEQFDLRIREDTCRALDPKGDLF